MKNVLIQMPTEPTNLIFTGVAGTGKTHRLLAIQKLYDETIEASWHEWRLQQISHYSWCDVVCAVLLLEDRLMTVPEMMRHQLIRDKATANKRSENINQTIWVQLNTHAHPESETVNSSQRSANYYFDKTESSQWYLLDEVKPTLQQRLTDLLSFYDNSAQQHYAKSHVISRSCLVSFHQSYGYDEFVEGIRPHINQQTGQMQYEIKKGAFLELCDRAVNDPDHRYAVLIDEINRANTAQVFGELMSVIEPSKRAGQSTPMSVRLAYSGHPFSVPSNVDIYATMNTQDHSLATLDTAFRRRFDFETCYPDSSVVTSVVDAKGETVDLAQLMDALNQRLYNLGGSEVQLGHSYFMNIHDMSQLALRLYKKIIPQIIEYIKLSAMPNQIPELLMQILYGYSAIDEVHKIEHCLLQPKPFSQSNSLHSSPVQSKMSRSQIVSAQSLLEPDFVSASLNINKRQASEMSTIETDSFLNDSSLIDSSLGKEELQKHSSQSVNAFLSAKTYQQLYILDS